MMLTGLIKSHVEKNYQRKVFETILKTIKIFYNIFLSLKVKEFLKGVITYIYII
jgi:hypothetical protein